MIKKTFILLLTLILCNVFADTSKKCVVKGDYVRVRMEPKLKGDLITFLFRGNEATLLGMVKGDSYKNQDQWVKIRAPYFYGEGYIHSSLVLTGNQAFKYIKSFNIRIFNKQIKKLFSNKKISQILTYYHSLKN